MNIDFTPDEEAFRAEVREWMRQNVPRSPEAPNFGIPNDYELNRAWERKLADKGWLAYSWPKAYGGPGWTVTQRYIFDAERALAGGPPISPFGVIMLGPVLMKFGSQAQKDRYLPAIRDAKEAWCQGFSEPQAGSDLAALKTRAERRGDRYVVNGQKIWTTHAHWADFIFCLVRTDADVPKQQGISFLMIDMRSPGIEIRPIRTIDGHHHLNEVFFTDVEVPIENLVGQEGQGWTIAKYLLVNERTGIAGVAESKRQLGMLRKVVAADPARASDPAIARRLAELRVQLLALEYTHLRVLDLAARGSPIGLEPSVLKIKGSELQQAISEAELEIGGLECLPWLTDVSGSIRTFKWAAERYNFLRASSIFGGSNEVQKNIMAKLLLAQH
ncbi:acyl-CoA dehydrogenase family protein [Sinimarinibacterium thermocellulolyticum]|uniref:Acyl-CoA dehydrogenase family protein n=1 Tax=Sinimarinibacterium thermocellulolyticum TaxID=3170016 RepID=A0ABV2A978_9GAMM